ncbi:MAG: AAA family ATPase, partial [Prevotella sp.]|nr:AAA family ATPase [Prevotella sp.]
DDDDNPLREPKVRLQILPPLRNPKEEMDKLVGCQDIKQRIEQLTMMSRYNRMMRTANPEGKRHELALHSIFYGRPGTGKTTVCKIMGGLLRKSGALSIGHVVVCSRKDFIGTHWGDEERVVRKAVEEAKGGVLMIDEAYQLVSENPNDPGRLVIPLLMDVLSDEKQRDIAIVLCGYKDEMKKLIDLNPGLNSRFPNVFEFKDFTIDELLEITERRVKEYGYAFTRAAWRKYRGIIEDAYKVRDANTWGNARFIANLLDKIYLNHAMRCVKKSGMDRRHLLQITPADVQPIEVAKPKPHFGF